MTKTSKHCTPVGSVIPDNFEGCILLSVAHPGRAAGLAAIAAALAAAEGRPVLVLNVQRPKEDATPPHTPDDPSQWPAVARALEALAEAGTHCGWLVCQANDVGWAIRDVATQARANTVVLGWRGKMGSADGTVSNAMLKHVLQDPLADVVVVGGATPQRFDRILAPYASGPHSELALKIGLDLAHNNKNPTPQPGAALTALHVVADPTAGPSKGAIQALKHALNGLDPSLVEAIESVNDDPVAGILEEMERGYDLVIMGTSREEVIDQVLFGVLPQRVAEQSNAPVIVVRRHTPLAPRIMRRAWHLAYDALPTLTPHEQAEVSAAIRKGATTQVDFYMMISLSTIIAALGLLLNSPAVIIGAMLVAPLMSAIIGMALGIVHGDRSLLLKSARTSAAGIAVAVAIGLVIGWLVPSTNATTEVMARTAPSLLDLFVALAAGAAGAYALCRKEVAASLAGVAIAVALVPPLATMGITLSLLRWDLVAGASLLFATNLVAIAAAGAVVFLLLGFAPPASHKQRRLMFWRSLWGVAVLLGAIALILGVLTWQSLRQVNLDRALEAAIAARLDERFGADLVESSYTTDAGGVLHIYATVRSVGIIPEDDIRALQQELVDRLGRPAALDLAVLPSIELPAVAPSGEVTPTSRDRP
jgi:uncharacterized hydrophobic protein (TIGR00271 family)